MEHGDGHDHAHRDGHGHGNGNGHGHGNGHGKGSGKLRLIADTIVAVAPAPAASPAPSAAHGSPTGHAAVPVRDAAAGERRRALALDPKARAFYLGAWALAVLVVGAFCALGVLLSRAVPLVTPGFGRFLFIGIGAAAFGVVLAALLLALYATIHVHRAVGAAHALRRAVRDLRDDIADDRPPRPIALRESDYLRDVAEEVNGLAARWASTAEAARRTSLS